MSIYSDKLRAYADDAEADCKDWVTITPSTLRTIADQLDKLEALKKTTRTVNYLGAPLTIEFDYEPAISDKPGSVHIIGVRIAGVSITYLAAPHIPELEARLLQDCERERRALAP